MLRLESPPPRRFHPYGEVLPRDLAEEVVEAAERLRGARVLHVNSTSQGGGVAEVLRSTVPLLRDLGVDASWGVLQAPPEFFEVTKKVHNAMQGGPEAPDERAWALYERVNRDLAADIEARDWDLVVVHDPQPAAAPSHVGGRERARWLWRCHLDTSRPNPECLARLEPFLDAYDARVYSLPQYALAGARDPLAVLPGIDPLAPKNAPLDATEAAAIVAEFGLDADRPLATQVSRFDPWKDPLGVLQAWREARRDAPDLQLALVGDLAGDDPEGERILLQVLRQANGEEGVHVIANRATDEAVNAFQRHSTVVLQKSLREGFGLTVSEALWKGTPVIGGDAGGIPLQVDHGRSGFLVRSPEDAARRMVELARDPERARRMGAEGRERVRRDFLLPRMLRDEMRIWADVLGRGRPAPAGARGEAAAGA